MHLPTPTLLRASFQAYSNMFADVEAFMIQNDRSVFSRLSAIFENGVAYLLSQQEVEGIPDAALRAFHESYGSTAFRCRYPRCVRSSLGFASQDLRIQHEMVHFQRVYCKVSACQFGRVGFAKRSALSAHVRKYHAEVSTLPIPPKVRRVLDAPVAQQKKELLRPDDVLKLQHLSEDEKQKYRGIMMEFWIRYQEEALGTPAKAEALEKLAELSSMLILHERQYRRAARQEVEQQQTQRSPQSQPPSWKKSLNDLATLTADSPTGEEPRPLMKETPSVSLKCLPSIQH